jgi:outer membrane protein assembly factor BamB
VVAARAGIACYSRATSELVWQRWLCRSNTPATGKTAEIVNDLLTYDGGIIYANTNLGVVAAVRAANGGILWLRTYDRRKSAGDDADAYYQHPNPCVYQHGQVFVLPTDSNALMAINAANGSESWRYPISDLKSRIVAVVADRMTLIDVGVKELDLLTGKVLPERSAGTGDLGLTEPETVYCLATDEMLFATGRTKLAAFAVLPTESDAYAP